MLENRKYEVRTDKDGIDYFFYTAKPFGYYLHGKYYIRHHDKVTGKHADWETCIAMHNLHISKNYTTGTTKRLLSYTAEFVEIDAPPPRAYAPNEDAGPRNICRRCSGCDNWFLRVDLERWEGVCPICSGRGDLPDSEELNRLNKYTKRVKKCVECGKYGPKRLSSTRRDKELSLRSRWSPLCPHCWRKLARSIADKIYFTKRMK